MDQNNTLPISISSLLHAIESQYQVTIRDWKVAEAGGFENINVFITVIEKSELSTCKWVVRLSKIDGLRGTKSWIEFEMELLTKLSSNGILVPHIISTANGEKIFDFDDESYRFGIVTQYCMGEHITNPSRESWQVESIGKALANIHNITQDWKPHNSDIRGSVPHSPHIVSNFYNSIKDYGSDISESVEEDLLELFKLLEDWQPEIEQVYNQLPSGVIHCDLHEFNTLFHENQLKCILD